MNEVTKTPRTYRDGMCYGSGDVGLNIRGGEVRKATCPECGKEVGLHGGKNVSVRVADHKPPDLAKQSRDKHLKRMAARIQVQDWIQLERKAFDAIDLYHVDVSWMAVSLIDRASREGLSHPRSRQEMGKTIVALMHILEKGVQEHGPMPKPGKALVEDIETWVR